MILFRTLSISPLLTVLTLRPLPLLVLKSLFLSSALFLILKTVLLWHPKVVWILATEHLALSIPRIWFRRDSASGGAIAAPTVTQFLVRERVLVGDVVHHDGGRPAGAALSFWSTTTKFTISLSPAKIVARFQKKKILRQREILKNQSQSLAKCREMHQKPEKRLKKAHSFSVTRYICREWKI